MSFYEGEKKKTIKSDLKNKKSSKCTKISNTSQHQTTNKNMGGRRSKNTANYCSFWSSQQTDSNKKSNPENSFDKLNLLASQSTVRSKLTNIA